MTPSTSTRFFIKQDPEMATAGDTKSPPEVNKVAVRIPPFWPEEPAVWFAQIEGQFALAGITTDATKFYYVIAQLDHQYAAEVKDIIINPPAQNKYDKLRTELIKRLSASHERKVKQLLTHEELGDRKPSQFLRHLQTLAGPGVPDDFLRTLWSGRLPSNIQTVVASQLNLSLEQLADLADRVYDIVPYTPQVATTTSEQKCTLSEMSMQIAELSRQVASLQSRYNENNRSGNRSRDRRVHSQRFRSRSKSRDSSVCWYHNKFGPKANKCTSPCSYSSSSGNASGSRK